MTDEEADGLQIGAIVEINTNIADDEMNNGYYFELAVPHLTKGLRGVVQFKRHYMDGTLQDVAVEFPELKFGHNLDCHISQPRGQYMLPKHLSRVLVGVENFEIP